MPTAHTKLHTDTAQLHEMTQVRTHADLIRVFHSGLAELVNASTLTFANRKWYANGVLVAEYADYTDPSSRVRVCIRFGSWLCLALALKVSREETRKALLDALNRHPLY